ncbi:MAG: hypothetical protein ACLT8Y_02260 [Dorea formicigenerans]
MRKRDAGHKAVCVIQKIKGHVYSFLYQMGDDSTSIGGEKQANIWAF